MAKTILITGANRGIGLAFCQRYLVADYTVYACCRAPESSSALLAMKQQQPERLEIIPLDVTDQAMRASLADTLAGQAIDILINNAGIYGPRGIPLGEGSEADWLDVFKVNTIAPWLLTQLLADNVAKSQERKVVLLTSKMGSIAENTSGGSYVYRSSKAALNAVGKSLAHDLAARGIRVALVHPGWVQTDMGGANALISTEQSVAGLCQVIAQLNNANSGQFFNYDGTVIPW